MCGIAGIIHSNSNLVSVQTLKQMTDAIAHRGPDGEGHWISNDGKVALGHRRLSIIDLSMEANQPMHYLEKYSLVFNGEIYNYIELKQELIHKGYQFTTQSDTEVLMALYDCYKEACLTKLDGMFAFAIYDENNKTVFLARDRFGEKPFFYSYQKGSHFLFGSEMKSLWAGGIDRNTNKRMLFNYLSFGFIENPEDLSETFYENCTRLPHGHYATLNTENLTLSVHKYYDIAWQETNFTISYEAAKERFKELFYTSIQRRLRSDVSVGSSLSGGLDSSLVVMVIDDLKKGTTQKQNTFSAVFPGYEKDERKYMDYIIAKTQVTPHFVTPNEIGLINNLQKLNWHQEEPYGSSSIYAQYCVMELARKNNTTVLLDGQGADEILAGYHHYFLSFFNEKSKKDKKQYHTELDAYNHKHKLNTINGLAKKNTGYYVRKYIPGLEKSLKGIRLSAQQKSNSFYNNDFFNQYKKSSFEPDRKLFDTLNESLYHSSYTFGLQQLLRYADRNSMAHSVEVRLPFLYHELAEFLITLPAEFKLHEGWTKYILRDTFNNLPKEIGWRVDKIGYEPPQKNWLQHPVIEELIREGRKKFISNGILHSKHTNAKITAPGANDINQLNWRELMAFSMF